MRVSLRALTDGVFPYNQPDRRILVLRAYLDDSGTHDSSRAIIMGGLIAHEDEWVKFEVAWGAFLADFGLSAMHASHCEAGDKEFEGVKREIRDAYIIRCAKIIAEMDALLVVSAVSRSAWDEAVAQREVLSEAFPSPIDLCFNDVFQRCTRWGRRSAGRSEPIVITFDAREQSIPAWQRRAAGYQARFPEKVAGVAFGNMKQVLPLQAADLIAYEAYRFHLERERLGREPDPRPSFELLASEMARSAGYFTTDQLLEYAGRLRDSRRD